jgi:hypothetical protein
LKLKHDETLSSFAFDFNLRHYTWGGHLHILTWAHESGLRWDRQTCSSAAANGHFEIMKYAREHGCRWDEATCTGAARAAGPIPLHPWP